MKFVDEFRDPSRGEQLIGKIWQETRPDTCYRFMEFCGGHTHAIARFGLKDRLPDNIHLIHGPGCPVCILPTARMDMALALVRETETTLTLYGDCLRVPGSRGKTLEAAKAEGARITVVHSPRQVLELALDAPGQAFVFLAIGFETTAPATAHLVERTIDLGLQNLSLLINHVLTPPAINALLDDPTTSLHGLIGPAHVSVIIGLEAYARLVETHQIPFVVAGFEPLDLLQAILMLVRQVNSGNALLENEFSRAVSVAGNMAAQAAMARVFETQAAFEWRGLGRISESSIGLRPNLKALDAEERFGLTESPSRDHRACECAAILRGHKAPEDCQVFGTACTPDTPLGACMVSSEGACAAHYRYGRGLRRS